MNTKKITKVVEKWVLYQLSRRKTIQIYTNAAEHIPQWKQRGTIKLL